MFNSKLLSVVFLLAVWAPLPAQIMRTLMQRPDYALESKWEVDSEGAHCLVYENKDNCDYYAYRVNDNSYELRPGKNTIFRRAKNENFDNQFRQASSYYFYRGIFPNKFNIQFPYAFPVKKDSKVMLAMDRRERVKTLRFRMEVGDTVYATRSGMACSVYDPRILLVYHQDHTFAAYLTMRTCFVVPGESVQVGQPVGIANEKGVSISFFFLDENKFASSTASGYPYTHFIPTFRTTQGDLKPSPKTVYQTLVDDDLITKEMSKREKKKYMKRKK